MIGGFALFAYVHRPLQCNQPSLLAVNFVYLQDCLRAVRCVSTLHECDACASGEFHVTLSEGGFPIGREVTIETLCAGELLPWLCLQKV